MCTLRKRLLHWTLFTSSLSRIKLRRQVTPQSTQCEVNQETRFYLLLHLEPYRFRPSSFERIKKLQRHLTTTYYRKQQPMVKTKVIYQHTIVFIHRALNVWKEYQSAKYSGGPNIEVVLTYTRISNMWSSWNTSAELDKIDLLYFHLTITILTDAIFDVRGIAYMCTTGRFAKSKATDRGIDVANAIVIYCQRTKKNGVISNRHQDKRDLPDWQRTYRMAPGVHDTTRNARDN